MTFLFHPGPLLQIGNIGGHCLHFTHDNPDKVLFYQFFLLAWPSVVQSTRVAIVHPIVGPVDCPEDGW
jgi:hypothetical protein